jgi:hypothetical protein
MKKRYIKSYKINDNNDFCPLCIYGDRILFKVKHYFALLEAIVSLAVFLIFIATVLIFYDAIFNVTISSKNSKNLFSNARTALDIITRDIQCIYYKNEMIPFWHKGETGSGNGEFDNDLLAFISATPLPHSSDISSKLCEVKYQLYNENQDNPDPALEGWIRRSVTGDNDEIKWNFQYNFNVGIDDVNNAFTANDDSSEPYFKFIPYVTELTFECYDKNGVEILPTGYMATQFPYSIRVNLSLMDDVSWKKYKTDGADKYLIKIQNVRTFSKTIFVGEHGQ